MGIFLLHILKWVHFLNEMLGQHWPEFIWVLYENLDVLDSGVYLAQVSVSVFVMAHIFF